MWNCARGLLSENESKFVDVQNYIFKHKPHLFCVTEADLHGPRSRILRRNTFSTDELVEKLHIPGYSLVLPDTWKTYDQARIVVFVSDNIKADVIPQNPNNHDLPLITFDVGLGRAKKTRVNFGICQKDR